VGLVERRAEELYIKEADVFAAYTAYTDHEIGRVIQEVEDEGKLDNTLIIYIDGDNRASVEGTLTGTFNSYLGYNGLTEVPIDHPHRTDQCRFAGSGQRIGRQRPVACGVHEKFRLRHRTIRKEPSG
jgi:hypothetical protein